MKKLFYQLALIAAAAITVSACEKENFADGSGNDDEVKWVISSASIAEDDDTTADAASDTRAEFGDFVDGKYKFLWSKENELELKYIFTKFVQGAFFKELGAYTQGDTKINSVSDDGSKIWFLLPEHYSDGERYYNIFYPAQYTSISQSGSTAPTASLSHQHEQHPLKAGTPAPEAIGLYCFPTDIDNKLSGYDVNLQHAFAYVKLHLTGLSAGERINKATITETYERNSTVLSGTLKISLNFNNTNNIMRDQNASTLYPSIDVIYDKFDNPVADENGEFDVWFTTSNGCYSTSNNYDIDALQITIETDKSTYTKTRERDQDFINYPISWQDGGNTRHYFPRGKVYKMTCNLNTWDKN